MANFNMSKLYLGKDGNYRDAKGTIIAQKGKPLNGSAWKYLASKYGKEYANRTSMNTRNGNIFQNGRWRFNDIQSDKEGRTASWDEANSRIKENSAAAGAKYTKYGYMQKNPFNNKDTYLNQDSKNKSIKIHTAKQKTQTQPEDVDKFEWSDLNPFKEGAYDGNWESAKNNFIEGFKSIPETWEQGIERASQIRKDSNSYHSVFEPERNYVAEYLGEGLGTVGRVGNTFLGSTVGTGIQLLLPQKAEKEAAKLGQILDVGKDLNSVRSLLHSGEETLMPWDEKNKGFADKNFAWTGIDERQRQNINDLGNFATAIWGAGSMKSGLSNVKSGISQAVHNGIRTTIKSSWKPIVSHTPVAANVYQAGKALNYTRKAVAPRSLGGANSFFGRVGNVGKAGLSGMMASDPMMALAPYMHSGFISGLNN